MDSVNSALCNHTISGTGRMASLNSLLQGELRNEVPEAVLRQCPEAEQLLVENVLRLAQAELGVLNLASTSVVLDGSKLVLKSVMTGPTPSISLSSMQSLQAYSPASIIDLRAALHDGCMHLVMELGDSTSRISATELQIVRVTKRRRLSNRLLTPGLEL